MTRPFDTVLHLTALLCLQSLRHERLLAGDTQGVHRAEAELRRLRHLVLAK